MKLDGEQYFWFQNKLNGMENRLFNLEKHLIPVIKDISKCIVSMRESMSCANPKNHKREGKMPRKQPKKKEHETWSQFSGG